MKKLILLAITGLLLSACASTSFEDFSYEGLDCERFPFDGNVEVYECGGLDLEWPAAPEKVLLRYASGEVEELTEFEAVTAVQAVDQRHALVTTYSMGAHCCHEGHIVDMVDGELTGGLMAGSTGISLVELEGNTLLQSQHAGFEYFLGPFANHVPVYRYSIVNESGWVDPYNSFLPEDTLQKHFAEYDSLLAEEQDFIEDASDLCSEWVGDVDPFCSYASYEARVLAVKTAMLLLAGSPAEAEELFFSTAEDTEENRKIYEDIVFMASF